jgi:sulfide dehydrogenase [flavocytochrome c] flavoprotein subunit
MSHTRLKPSSPSPFVQRREFLAASAALSSAAWLPISGCANTPRGASIGHVVVIGGGFGGATVARYLKKWGGAIDVTLIERQAAFISCPMSNLVLEGRQSIDDITLSYRPLEKLGVRRIQAEVQDIDAQGKRVRLADGTHIAYDRLVLSPGVDFMTDAIGGLAAAEGRVLHAWKAGAQTLALRQQLQAMPNGGVYAITIPAAPYRCPPGPYERACMVASYFKKAKPQSKVLILDANPDILSKKALFEKAFKDYYGGMIEYRASQALKEVNVSTQTAILEFDNVRADVLNVIPPMRAGELAFKAGVIAPQQRWASVNWLTLESTLVPFVHVLGDATLSAPQMPKSGHMANQQAKVAAAAIIALLRGQPVAANPVVMNTCYSYVSASEAIHVASVHQYDAQEKTFKTVPGSGGVSSGISALEGQYAWAWAQNIWADTLALS